MTNFIDVESTRVDNCVLCGSSELESLGFRAELAQNRRNAFRFVFDDHLCETCGFVFSRERPKEDLLTQYYESYFRSLSEIPDAESEYRTELISSFIKPGDSILEIGGGYGKFRDYLERWGFSVSNFDLSGGTIEREKYDLVCHYYVMEHVNNPREWLAQQVDLLADGGFLIVEIPNFSDFPSESLNNEHVNHFRPQDLENAIHMAGLEVVTLLPTSEGRYFGMVAIGRKSRKSVRPVIAGSDLQKSRDAYNTAVEQFGALHRRIKDIFAKITAQTEEPTIGIWPSNQATLRVLPLFDRNGLGKLKLFDIDYEKHGLDWGGTGNLVRLPSEMEAQTCSHFLLLSPTHNQKIRASLNQMGFENSRIFEL